jgi:hypothetical protein
MQEPRRVDDAEPRWAVPHTTPRRKAQLDEVSTAARQFVGADADLSTAMVRRSAVPARRDADAGRIAI